ncbi:MAG: hypothetical protein WCH35_15410 [Comamonadaceae bacterium]
MKFINAISLPAKLIRMFAVFLATLTLASCGGGGDGFPGFRNDTSSAAGGASAPTLTLAISGGGNSIAASGSTVAQATVKDASGALVNGKLVTFSGDAALVKFSPASGQVLTVNGVASIQVSPTSLFAAGAGTLTAQASVADKTLSSSFDFQLAAANLGLQSLNLGSGSLAAYGSRPISVMASVNGVAATSTPVQVTFNASCGSVAPSVATTDATGVANSTYTATLASCVGTNVTVTASTDGAATVSGTVAVAVPMATNVQFVSATPQLIYLKDSTGPTQALVVFKVVDSGGNTVQNKKLRLSLSNSATGVTLNSVGNILPVDLTTDGGGQVAVAVFSGTIPTSLNVKATLLDGTGTATNVYQNSNVLTVASGRPTQKSLSLSLEKFSIEAMNVDGQTTKVTLSMADRQGNPVPPGTQVNFVTESGVMQPAVCVVPAGPLVVSSCAVTLSSSGTRTVNGRVSILAYVAGEEDFVDLNGNNVYDIGEPFADLGRPYRDDNGQSASGANGVFDAGEFQVPRDGSPACVAGQVSCSSDGVWGAADVRRQATVVFASGQADIVSTFQPKVEILPANTGGTYPASMVTPALDLTIGDMNGNSVPTGSTIAVSVTDNSLNGPVMARTPDVVDPATSVVTAGKETAGTCELVSPSSFTVPNALGSLGARVVLKNCTSGDFVNIKVTTPLSTETSKTFVVP